MQDQLSLPSIDLMGVRVHQVMRAQLLQSLAQAVTQRRPTFVANVNTHAMNLAWIDAEFRTILNAAELVFVDGAGVLLASRLCHKKLGERLTYADWTDDWFAICEAQHWSIFWLGDTPEVAQAFVATLQRRHPGIRIAGCQHGFFDRSSAANEAVCQDIRQSQADVLLVGMSMPIQEKWIALNRHRLATPVMLSAGGFARIYTGQIPRAPRWMTQHGLEWLWLFLQRPRYTAKRYWLGNPLFLLRALAWRYAGKRPLAS